MDVFDIPGGDLAPLRIRIKYLRDPVDGTVKNTLAWRRFNGRIFFGIARYNPKDRILDKVQPMKKIGRKEAIKKLYEAERTMYDSAACLSLGKNGTMGCCNYEGVNAMYQWFIQEGFANWH